MHGRAIVCIIMIITHVLHIMPDICGIPSFSLRQSLILLGGKWQKFIKLNMYNIILFD